MEGGGRGGGEVNNKVIDEENLGCWPACTESRQASSNSSAEEDKIVRGWTQNARNRYVIRFSPNGGDAYGETSGSLFQLVQREKFKPS